MQAFVLLGLIGSKLPCKHSTAGNWLPYAAAVCSSRMQQQYGMINRGSVQQPAVCNRRLQQQYVISSGMQQLPVCNPQHAAAAVVCNDEQLAVLILINGNRSMQQQCAMNSSMPQMAVYNHNIMQQQYVHIYM